MILSLICAMARNKVIGRDNQLPWHLPDEMRHFKERTEGKPVIMGRKTFESLPFPLPKRKNIVVTRQKTNIQGVEVVNSLERALTHAQQHCIKYKIDECFIIGGAVLYAEALPLADQLYLTTVNADVEGDTYFPEYDDSWWCLVAETHHAVDSRHPYSYDIRHYERAT